jgi:hypothetical protein
MEQPELPAQEALAPVGPALTAKIPFSAGGVHRKPARVLVDQAVELLRGKVKKTVNLGLSRHTADAPFSGWNEGRRNWQGWKNYTRKKH